MGLAVVALLLVAMTRRAHRAQIARTPASHAVAPPGVVELPHTIATIAAPSEAPSTASAGAALPLPTALGAPSASAAPPIASRCPTGGESPAQFEAEQRLLGRAESQAATDPGAALASTREHRMRFPCGQLGAERELIAVHALMRLGRTTEARARASALLRRSDGSLYADRVHQLVGATP
jgi:hypothetical protein